MSMSATHTTREQAGFTIIELMIATLVFSVILTVITIGVISFTNHYYKGVNISATQNTARGIVDSISQAIQFGTAPVQPTSPATSYFCAGGYVFTYANTGTMYTGSQTGLYMSPMGSTCQPAAAPFSGGKQLLAKNMRLTNISVTPVGSSADRLYAISVSVAYGPDDLLCSVSQPGTCDGSTAMVFWPVSDVSCRSIVGSQYCAVSTLKTTVEQRVGS